MSRVSSTLFLALAPWWINADWNGTTRADSHVDRYNVTWREPAKDGRDSMPLGNGDISVNAWMEASGSLVLTIGKADSWGDNGRLLKIGRLRVALDPPQSLENFQQELCLEDATLRASWDNGAGRTRLSVWVDAHHPTIQVQFDTASPTTATATMDIWRTEPMELPSVEVSGIYYDRLQKPIQQRQPTVVEPDIVLTDLPSGRIGWIHHNGRSLGPALAAELQGLADIERPEPLLNRIFGVIVEADGSQRVDQHTLELPSAVSHHWTIYVHTEHPSRPVDWQKNVNGIIKHITEMPRDERQQKHAQWWQAFWNRSWIHVTERTGGDDQPAENDDAYVVSRGYALQRYLHACAGRGRYAIKFNGSLFTVAWPDKPGDADYRRWGPGYWWQNTRFPYLPMCAAGDFDLMQPLIRMYLDDVMPVAIARTRRYFGHGGAFFPECVYFWEDVFPDTYGWTPYDQRGRDKLQEAGWHKWEWVAGPELLHLILERFEYMEDRHYLEQRVLPASREILGFFDQHYELDDNGQYHMYPGQALETWWDCTNPMPELAGLYDLTERLLHLSTELVPADDRELWQGIRKKLPPLPIREVDGKRMLAPAARFEHKVSIEHPELYAVFPFRQFGVGRPDIDLAVEALNHRQPRSHHGWHQDDIFMACLGLADDAQAGLVQRARNHDPACRFPAFWGPNFDWTPDQTHGGALMKTLQLMVLQVDHDRLFLLPAWPESWNVEFKLHAPQQTTVAGTYRDGKLERLDVRPAERAEAVSVAGQIQKALNGH